MELQRVAVSSEEETDRFPAVRVSHPSERALRIALVLETSGGGSGRHVLDLASGLVARGHHICVIWSPVRAQQDFVAQLKAISGVETRTLEMNRQVGAADARSRKNLIKVIKEAGPFDILHGHSSKAGALVRLLPRSVGGKRIYTPHAFRTMDPDLGAPQRLVYGTIEKLLAARTDKIIAVSEAERVHATTRLGISERQTQRVINGVDLPPGTSRSAARAEMGLQENDIAIGFVGRLDTQKNPLRFVQAVSAARKSVPEIRGIVIGDGALRAAAEAAADKSAFRFMGWCDGPKLFAGLDIFCMTSQYEAMPYTLLEALHAGVPIISTAVGGVEETVVDGENGHILPLDADDRDIGKVLAEVAGSAGTRTAFGAAGKTLARKRTIDDMVDNTLGVYYSTLTQGEVS